MPVFDPSMTADKAAATMPADVLNASGHSFDTPGFDPGLYQTKGFIDARRKGRQNAVPPELDVMKDLKRIPVHIFNVGPFAHVIPCGSAGTFYIPACPEGQPYIKMLTPLHEIVDEIYPKTKNSDAKRLYDDGKKFAIELLGEGRNQHKRNSKRKVGVFIAKSEVPTEKELKEARAQLVTYCNEQVHIIDGLWDRDRKLAYDVYRPETFGACARVLGLTGKEKGWLAQGEISTNISCKWCGENVNPNAPVCRNCKNVVNQEAYLALQAEQQSLQEAIAPKKAGK
jgi:hypothetical protein